VLGRVRKDLLTRTTCVSTLLRPFKQGLDVGSVSVWRPLVAQTVEARTNISNRVRKQVKELAFRSVRCGRRDQLGLDENEHVFM
jgi:hypothetical protein